jgi:hypothetical protein
LDDVALVRPLLLCYLFMAKINDIEYHLTAPDRATTTLSAQKSDGTKLWGPVILTNTTCQGTCTSGGPCP